MRDISPEPRTPGAKARARECAHCQHYRPQASYVDAYKLFLSSKHRAPTQKALLEILKEEAKVLENEIEVQFELLRGEEVEWTSMPRFAPVCVAGGRASVAALRNRSRRCSDYEPALGRQQRNCGTCEFQTAPLRRVGENKQNLQAGMEPYMRAHVLQENRDLEEGEATAMAVELEETFYSDGLGTVVEFLPTCGARITDGQINVVPACNLRGDCKDHSGILSVPFAVVEAIRNERRSTEPAALEACLALVRMVADAGPAQPEQFCQQAVAWLQSRPGRRSASSWVAGCMARWQREVGVQGAVAVPPELSSPPEAPGQLLPVIAGCDAFEWGQLAALSKVTDASAAACASALCQQLAEFSQSVVCPFGVARAVDACARMLEVDGLFSSTTVARVGPFMKRIGLGAGLLCILGETDLPFYLEQMLSRASYAAGTWLRDGIAKGIEKLREYPAVYQQERSAPSRNGLARMQAWNLLSILASLDRGRSGVSPTEVLTTLLAENRAGVERDVAFGQAITAATREAVEAAFGYSPSDLSMLLLNLRMKSDEAESVRKELESKANLQRRELSAKLMLLRGASPVTPSGLDLLGQAPRPDSGTPTTVEEALLQPTFRTVEAFHVARFGTLADGSTAAYLASVRRLCAPEFAPLANGVSAGSISPS